MLADVSCTVTRTETTFDAVLEEICRSYAAEYNARRSTEEATAFDFLSLDMLQRAAAELLTSMGCSPKMPRTVTATGGWMKSSASPSFRNESYTSLFP